MEGRKDVNRFIKALRDEDDDVREYATEALGKITGEDFGEDHEKWLKWWQQNKERFLKNK
jgi:HEAT repeat protein